MAQIEVKSVTTIASRMPQNTMRRPLLMVSSASLRPLAQEVMTKVRISLAQT